MADYSAYEGQKFTFGDNTYTVTNGKFVDQNGKVFDYDPPVTTGQGQVQPFHMPGPYEAAKDVGTQLGVGTAEAIEQAGTLPFGVANWTGKGMQAAAPVVGQVAPDTAKSMASAGQTLEQGSQPYTFEPQWAKEVQQHPFLGSQPQTEFGAMARQVPAVGAGALAGGEGLIPAAARTAGAIGGGEVGQYLTGSPWGQMVGSLLGYGGIPTGPLRGDSTMVRRLMNQGTDVSAAQRTGSSTRSLLEGGPPAGQMKDISDSMLRQAGVVRRAGDDRPITELAQDRQNQLDAGIKGLKANTSLPAANARAVWRDIGQMDLAHTATGTGGGTGQATSLIDPRVHEAYEDFEKLAKGGQDITGEQYSALSQKWRNTDSPVVNAMGHRLDVEMEKINPEWTKWNDDYANLQGVRGAIDKASAPTTKGIDPGVVYKSMYRNTDMRKYADAAREVTSQYPESKGGPTINSVAGLLAAGAGGLIGYKGAGTGLGALEGAGSALLPCGFGNVGQIAGAGINKLASSPLGQKYLMMNPKAAAAALLGQQAVQPEGQVKK